MLKTESPAVVSARAHVEAWSNHDFDTARAGLATDVKFTATTTNAAIPKTDLAGIDAYMQGLIAFAQGVVPGSARVIASVGDERNALLMLTVQMAAGPDRPQMTLRGARLYLLDEKGRIKFEQVVFYVVPN
jgi:SnoaL-like protein